MWAGGSAPPVRKDMPRAGDFMTGAPAAPPVRFGQPAPPRPPVLPDPTPIAEKLDTIAARLDALAQRVRSARTRT
jgi:hypothetical protein